MNKFLALSAVSLLALTGTAHAALLDVTLGATSSNVVFTPGIGSLSPNVTLSSSTVSLTNAYIIPAGTSSAGNYVGPTGSLYGGNYLAVETGGSAVFAGGSGTNTFGLTWGSIDAYNTLKLTDSRGVSYTITGAEILNAIAGSDPGATQEDVSLFDPLGTIVSAQLTSSANSFEAGNFNQSVTAVPLPASLPLFGLALVGMFFLARKKKNEAI